MLPRTQRCSGCGRCKRRISHSRIWPDAWVCSHSNTGLSPASAAARRGPATSTLREPSACMGGLSSRGPTCSNCSRDMPNSSVALLLTSTNFPVVISRITMASGACSTCRRKRCSPWRIASCVSHMRRPSPMRAAIADSSGTSASYTCAWRQCWIASSQGLSASEDTATYSIERTRELSAESPAGIGLCSGSLRMTSPRWRRASANLSAVAASIGRAPLRRENPGAVCSKTISIWPAFGSQG